MERAHVNMIGKYDTSGVCHHCGEVSFLYSFSFQNVFFSNLKVHLEMTQSAKNYFILIPK